MLIKEQGMRKAIIIGGGIAGLTLGIGLRQIRIEAEIYESAKTLQPIGHLDGTQCDASALIGSGWQLR
jgi:2-polyprenyl-6-methoxyphenol hydroxylase-like FAD-dependent oxidoreductase